MALWGNYQILGKLSTFQWQRQTALAHCINPLPDDKILDWSKLKQIADDILKRI